MKTSGAIGTRTRPTQLFKLREVRKLRGISAVELEHEEVDDDDHAQDL